MSNAFWENKTLNEMNRDEWESLCDRCGWCCLHKYEDDDGEIRYTNIVCRLYDLENSCCSQYENRTAHIPACTPLTPEKANAFNWLPESCAYRLINDNVPLPSWHPLIAGNTEKMHANGISIKSFAISETDVDMAAVEAGISDEVD